MGDPDILDWYLDVYRDHAGEWRWSLHAANGLKVADSAEGYTERNDCREAWERIEDVVAFKGSKVEVRYR